MKKFVALLFITLNITSLFTSILVAIYNISTMFDVITFIQSYSAHMTALIILIIIGALCCYVFLDEIKRMLSTNAHKAIIVINIINIICAFIPTIFTVRETNTVYYTFFNLLKSFTIYFLNNKLKDT